MRLTLIRTPGTRGGYSDQGTQDIGHHQILFGLAGHDGDWRNGQTDWQAYRLNDPLIAFQSPKHPGSLGSSFSLLKINNSRVRVLALKKAEQGDDLVLRIVEIDGKPAQDVHVAFAAPIVAAREVNAQEQPLGPATVNKGELVTSIGAYEPRTFALKLGPAPAKIVAPQSQPVALSYDTSVATRDGRPSEGCFDCSLDRPTAPQGKALPAEMLPAKLDFAGVHFNLAPATTGKPNAIAAHGQTIMLPGGKFNRVYLLAAAANGDQKATFRVGDKPVELTIQEWTGFIGQWDDRLWKREEQVIPPRPGSPAQAPGAPPRIRVNDYAEMIGLKPGFIKRADVAWFASHRHDAGGANEPYAYSYLFAYSLDLPPNTTTLTLPQNEAVRILAVTVANESDPVRAVQLLGDALVGEK
jgi:alpha-mannosidase